MKKTGRQKGDFPGGPVVKNLPRNAGDESLIPSWRTKIPQAGLCMAQLSLCTTIRDCAPQQKILRVIRKIQHTTSKN